MANPQPCKVCETEGVQTLADWLITAQSDVGGFEPGFTIWVCQGCLAGLMLAWVQAQTDQPGETPTTDADGYDVQEGPLDVLTGGEPEGPGVLEQIEHDEGTVTPAGNGRGRKSRPAAEPASEVEAQAETADVDC